MTFFTGASDFEINGGQFTDASTVNKTKKVTRIRNSGIIAGFAQEGGTVTAETIQVTREQEAVRQQPNPRPRPPPPPPEVSNVIPSSPQETNRNGTAIGVNEASVQLLRALATAILHLQVPAQALLEALGEQSANQAPNSTLHPSAAAFSSAVTGLTAMVQPNLHAASVSAPSIPHIMTSSPTPPNDLETRSTASGEGSQKRKPLFGRFSKKHD